MLGLVARGGFDRHLPRPGLALAPKRETMAALRALLEAGTLTPVVGRTFPLEEVPAAIRAMREGGVTGRIVIVP